MSLGTSTVSNALAADASSLNRLKLQAGQSSPETIRETAKQFESLFMRELIKSMREATMKSGLMDSPGSDLGNDLLDQQFAVQMSGQPGVQRPGCVPGCSARGCVRSSRQQQHPAIRRWAGWGRRYASRSGPSKGHSTWTGNGESGRAYSGNCGCWNQGIHRGMGSWHRPAETAPEIPPAVPHVKS